jgi:hypothetical protein
MAEHLGSRLIGPMIGGALLLAGISTGQESPLAVPEGVEVMARGPVHEAYAAPTEARPQASPLVAKQPPAPIEELPPDQKPEGDNVQWIPGYWAWDQDQGDYVWVSGFWRTPPPGRQWVPGNWQQVEGGWHWVAGFWAPSGQEEQQYLPVPPPSIDQGPSAPAPQAGSAYVPGCWIYRQTRYFWRPGFWMPYRPGWVWMPAHYVWTPGGCLFVEGYWDHPLEARGLLFAPVRLAARLLSRAGWFFTPHYAVQPDFLMGALFVRPATRHYYFGDYFENRYTRAGFVPWIDYRIGRFAYDPNFNYYRLGFARYGAWERGLRDLYQARFHGDIARPPHTLARQQELIQNITTNKTTNEVVNKNINITNMQNVSALTPLTQINKARVTNLAALANVREGAAKAPPVANPVLKLQAVPREQRVQEQKSAAQLHSVAQQRRQMEGRLLSDGGPPVRVTDKPRQGKIELPRPPQPPKPPPAPPREPKPAAKPSSPVRVVPPPPTLPKHEEKPIPRHEPPRPPVPPKQVAPPPKAPTPPPKAPPPHPPKKEPPKKEPPKKEPPKKEPPKKK